MLSNNKMKTKIRQSEVNLNELVSVGVSLVLVGLIFVYGTQIAVDVRDTDVTCPATHSYNTSNAQCGNATHNVAPTNPDFAVANNSIAAMSEIPDKLPTIAVILAVSVIIAVLLRAFVMKR